MYKATGFTIKNVLHQGTHRIAFEAVRDKDNITVVLKTVIQEFPTLKDLSELKHEYHILQKLDHPAIVRAIEWLDSNDRVFIVLNRLKGISLKEWLITHQCSIDQFFTISIALAEIIAYIHSHALIHKDIKPANILIDPETLALSIVDFGMSSEMLSENVLNINPNTLEGTIAYLSPEQTGRMNCSVDYRTDLYSLGVTLYETLTQRLPFETTDILELIYSHLAKPPSPPSSINPDIPEQISLIILKLMQKDPNARYNSAKGLMHDLEKCREEWQKNGVIELFSLGEDDVTDKLTISSTLYGRNKEREELLSIFEDFCRSDRSQVILVSGSSGVGKTSFIQEIYKPLSKHHGYFSKGTFELLRKNTPYYALMQALNQLIEQILSEKEEIVSQKRGEILAAVGSNGQLLIELIPSLIHLIGEQSQVPNLSPSDAINRFHFVLKQFLNVFTKDETPLIICLDDMQWADASSLDLLDLFLEDVDHCLFILSYRDNEVTSSHSLFALIDKWRRQEIPLHAIHLDNLQKNDIISFLQNTLVQNDVQSLADIIHEKTLGNPFFVIEFLKALHRENLLKREGKKWAWSPEEIKKKDFSSNVVKLMVETTRKFSEECQELLAVAACIGLEFDLNILATASQKPIHEIVNILNEPLSKELLLTVGDSERLSHLSDQELEKVHIGYRFSHDRVREAAESLLSEQQKKAIHLRIGRELLSSEKYASDHLIEILNHLNYSFDLIVEPAEKEKLFELNLKAAYQAKRAAAFSIAYGYYQFAIRCMDNRTWDNKYDLVFNLYKDLAECTYIIGKSDEGEKLFTWLIEKARTVEDKIDASQALIVQYNYTENTEKTMEIGLRALALGGIHLNKNPSIWTIFKEFVKLKWAMWKLSEADFFSIPPMKDPKLLKISLLIFSLHPVSYFSSMTLPVVLAFIGLRLGLTHGYSDSMGSGITVYWLMCFRMKLYKHAEFWKKRVFFYLEKPEMLPVTKYVVRASFDYTFTKNEIFENCKMGLQLAESLGVARNIINISIVESFWTYFTGAPIEETWKIYQRMLNILKLASSSNPDWRDILEFHHEYFAFLQSQAPLDFTSFSGYEKRIEKINDKTAQLRFYTTLCQAYYLKEDYASALKAGYAADAVKLFELGQQGLEAEFYYGLSIVANYHTLTYWKQLWAKRKLASIKKHLKWFTEQNIELFLHYYLLFDAALQSLEKSNEDYITAYNNASDEAIKQSCFHIAAIANEALTKIFLNLEQKDYASLHFRKAIYYYTRWGAVSKVEELKKLYDPLNEQQAPENVSITSTHSSSRRFSLTTTTSTDELDLETILRTNQAISSEIVLSKLLARLMKLLIENASAQRGMLILMKGNELKIVAEYDILQAAPDINERPLESQTLPLSILSFVKRTNSSLVLENASTSKYSDDPYIIQNKPLSTFCLPIIYKNRIMGLLYLENNALPNVFQSKQIRLLSLLAQQVAISVENAYLYHSMGRFVPVEFLKLLNKNSIIDVNLGDQVFRPNMTVLFCDVRNFTAYSETLTSKELFAFINEFLSRMELCIRAKKGVVDKYIGDVVMALFDESADNALFAAIAILEELKTWNALRIAEGKIPMEVGIGINTGELILGVIGGIGRIEGSVIGDTVNVASRLQSLTKEYKTPILLTELTYKKLQTSLKDHLIPAGEVHVRGRAASLQIFSWSPPDPMSHA